MKNGLFLLILTIFLSGCNKHNGLKQTFVGKWEYEQYSGYPFFNTFEPEGNGKIMVMFDDGTFERRMHDTVLFRGTYSVSKKDDCSPRENKTHFSTNDVSSISGYIEIADDKLRISTSNCLQDGGIVTYRKLER